MTAFANPTAMFQLITLFISGLIIYAAVTWINNSKQQAETIQQIEILLKEINSKLEK